MHPPPPPHLTPPSVHQHLSPSVRQAGRASPPQTPFHLLLSPLLYECWGVGRGRPWAGHPVRGLLRAPGLSAGAYRREIHINTCLLCLPPLDTARLPAWHRLHCVGLLSGHTQDGPFQCGTECKPPVGPPVAPTDPSRQCGV